MRTILFIFMMIGIEKTYQYIYFKGDHRINKIVEGYRRRYGKRKTWWGDFNAEKTRRLYHILLPKKKSDSEIFLICNQISSEKNRKEMWYNSEVSEVINKRYAAKIYSRERSCLPVLLYSLLFDFIRKNKNKSDTDIFIKYANQMGVSANIDKIESIPKDKYIQLCCKIMEKSSCTNKYIDTQFLYKKRKSYFVKTPKK